jgi:hypothetical protein
MEDAVRQARRDLDERARLMSLVDEARRPGLASRLVARLRRRSSVATASAPALPSVIDLAAGSAAPAGHSHGAGSAPASASLE